MIIGTYNAVELVLFCVGCNVMWLGHQIKKSKHDSLKLFLKD